MAIRLTSPHEREPPRDKRRLIVALLTIALPACTPLLCQNRSDPQDGPAAPPVEGHEPNSIPPMRRYQLPLVDAHVHLAPGALERLQFLMSRYGFDAVVNLSGGHPLGELKAQVAASQASAQPIIVFAALAYEQARYSNYGLRMAALLQRSYRLGARGLKIAKFLGLGLRDGDGQLVAVDAAELDPVFETAGRLGMPVAIHTGDPQAFWQPVTEGNPRKAELLAHPNWSLFGKDVPSFDALLQQLERRIARHPHTTFISVHFGNAAEKPQYVASLLRRFPNLYIDTAARIPELGRHPPDEIRKFFIEFQDRILYGSDLGVAPPGQPLFLGSSGPAPPTKEEEIRFFSSSRRYYETDDHDFPHPTPIQGNWTISGLRLPPKVLEKIYFRNAARLFNLDPEALRSSAARRPRKL